MPLQRALVCNVQRLGTASEFNNPWCSQARHMACNLWHAKLLIGAYEAHVFKNCRGVRGAHCKGHWTAMCKGLAQRRSSTTPGAAKQGIWHAIFGMQSY